ncbi:MAG: hypothetical protein GX456_16660 [Verrucomicrobia bacterium]|nr:hypothetical protein [Verrucomicrobiota bacterium]
MGIVVRNQVIGEVIGHVASRPEASETLTIAGRQHRVIRQDSTIVVVPVTDESADSGEDTPRYGGRKRRVSETFAAHVRQGCGLDNTAAPLVATLGEMIWFHFGGELFEAAFRAQFPSLLGAPLISGIVSRVTREFDSSILRSFDKYRLSRFLQSEGLRTIEDEGLGKFADELPTAGVEALISELRVAERFEVWLKTRNIVAVKPIRDYPTLELLLRNR